MNVIVYGRVLSRRGPTQGFLQDPVTAVVDEEHCFAGACVR